MKFTANSLQLFFFYPRQWFYPSLSPDLSRNHGLLASHRGHEVVLRQKVQRKLDQKASDFTQLLLSPGQVGLSQPWYGLELLQL